AMGSPNQYPWTLNLIWKLLQNDPGAVGLFRSNPFPGKPPRYIRAVVYRYSFVRPNSHGPWWKRDRLGLWLPPLSADDPDFKQLLRRGGWLHDYRGETHALYGSPGRSREGAKFAGAARG